MANVREKSLRGYCTEADQLIEQGSLEAAVAIGQHILRRYPKYMEAYRVLAKATLEQGGIGYAADLFKRVLSADPEDLEARVGLGIIYTGEEALQEAIWQWERAFELAPGNSDIRAQLRQVRERLEGPEIPRTELTRGALGRLYARGGLFQQAADEFRAVLRKDPEQIDIQVALAETLWRDGKLAKAEAVCEQILEALPNCLKANLILGHIWLHTGREEESHRPFRAAQALDPENRVAADLLGEESPLAREPVLIPELDELPLETPKPEDLISVREEAGLPDWLTQLRSAGIEKEEEIVEEEGLPDWLTALEPAKVEEPVAGMTVIETPSPEAGPELEGEELPDWLADLSVEEPEEPVTEPIPEAAEEEPLTAETLAPEPPAAEAEEIPDWLAALEPEEAEEPPKKEKLEGEPEVQGVSEPFVEKPIAAETADGDVPEWLAQLRTEMKQDLSDVVKMDMFLSPPKEDTDRFASRDIPEWLQDVQEESDLPVEALSEEDIISPAVEPTEEAPEWLAALEAEEAAAPEVAEAPAEPEVTEVAGPAEEMPDWLAALQPEEPAAPEVVEAPAEPEVPEADLWREIMRQKGLEEMIEAVPAEAEKLPEAAEPAEEMPDWLAALQAEEATAPEVAEAPAEPEMAEVAGPVEEMPDWLPALEAEEADEPAEEMPDWLAALQPEEAAAPEVVEAPAEPEAPETDLWREIMRQEGLEEMIEAVPAEAEELPEAAEPAEEIPDWLAALQPEEAAAPEVAGPAEEMPDWLAALQPEEPAAPEVVEAPTEPEVPETGLWREIMRQEGLEEMIEAVPAEAEELPEAAEPAEEIPDWLAALQPEEAAAPEVAEAPAEPEVSEADLWREIMRQEGLEEMIEAVPAEAEELPEAAEPAEEIPDWLAALQPEEAAAPEVAEAPAEPEVAEVAGPAEETPDWLAALQPEEPAAPEVVEAPAEPEVPETDLWREIMRQEGLEEMIEAVPAEAEELPEAAEPAEEIPDWLAALQPEEPAAPEVAEAPAEPEVAEVAGPVEEMPDWLAVLQPEEPAAPKVVEAPAEPEAAGVAEAVEPAEEIPDWLAALQPEEPAAPEVTEAPAEPEVTEVAAEAVKLAELAQEEELIEEVAVAGMPVEAEMVEPEVMAVEAEEAQEMELAPEEAAVPEWLAGWQEEAVLEEIVVEAAVEAEAEVSAAEMVAPEVAPKVVEESKEEEKEKEEPVSFLISGYLSRLATYPEDYEVRLALACAYRDEKRLDNAVEQFEMLIQSGRRIKELVPHLEGLCASYPGDARWHQLLGDAYIRANRLADALNAYRAAQNALWRR